jgi:hypothetical protein
MILNDSKTIKELNHVDGLNCKANSPEEKCIVKKGHKPV